MKYILFCHVCDKEMVPPLPGKQILCQTCINDAGKVKSEARQEGIQEAAQLALKHATDRAKYDDTYSEIVKVSLKIRKMPGGPDA